MIYGVDKEWLIAHPEIRDASVSEQYKLIHEVEGINAVHSNRKSGNAGHAQWDEKTMEYAKEHHLPMTAGSDIHSTNIFGGGMAFKRRLLSIQDFCNAIEEDYLLTNGDDWFNKQGEKI